MCALLQCLIVQDDQESQETESQVEESKEEEDVESESQDDENEENESEMEEEEKTSEKEPKEKEKKKEEEEEKEEDAKEETAATETAKAERIRMNPASSLAVTHSEDADFFSDMTFDSLNLSSSAPVCFSCTEKTQEVLAKKDFKTMTAIQSKAIPVLLAGKDVLGAAK